MSALQQKLEASLAFSEQLTKQLRESVEEMARALHDLSRQHVGIDGSTKDVRKAVDGIVSSTQAVENHVHESTMNLKSLAELVSTTKEIANQTNLLSLNAAIEAAKAGQY